ncbi:MAG: NHL repeat-containing protein [bacterium]
MRRALRLSSTLLVAALVFGPRHALALPRVEREPSSLVYPDFWHTPLGIHRGTQALLDLLLDGKVRFNDPEGAACAPMLGQTGVRDVTVFGVNSGAGQILYNPDMHSLAMFGTNGGGRGCFFRPQGIACLPDGTVAVADSGNNRVVLLNYRDGTLHWDRVLGSEGQGVGQFEDPKGVALDSQGRLFVADTGNNRIQVFDRDGVFLEAFGADAGSNNAISAPQALAVEDPLEPNASNPEAALFVLDLGGERLQKFSLDGDFIGQITAADLGRPLHGASLALDYFGNVWVTDRLSDQIHKFDGHLQWISDWGQPGQGDGCLDEPRGIAINRAYGQVIVLEKESAQYLWIGADLANLRLSHAGDLPLGGRLRIDYRLSERAWVDAWIEDQGKNRVATLLDHGFQAQGDQTLFWDGRTDPAKAKVVPGTYILVLRAEAAYSSARFVVRELKRRFSVPCASTGVARQ